MNAYEPSTNTTVSRQIPVFSPDQLPRLGECSGLTDDFSLYANILINWDDDHDPRILDLIDQEWPPGRARPLFVTEHEGNITLLWPDEKSAWKGAGNSFYVCPCGDTWNAEHLYLDGDEVLEMTRERIPSGFAELTETDEEPTVLA